MNKKFSVVIYEKSRNYGGPEEGGWWYDWETVIRVRLCRTHQSALRWAARWAREWRNRYGRKLHGPYEGAPCNSKNGYQCYSVRVEACLKPLPYQPDTHYS